MLLLEFKEVVKLKNLHAFFFDDDAAVKEAFPFYGLLLLGPMVVGVMSLVVN